MTAYTKVVSPHKNYGRAPVRACVHAAFLGAIWYLLPIHVAAVVVYNIIIAVVMEHGFIDKGDERMTWGEECSRHPLASS